MIRVLSPGLFTTVQDLGRHGYAHLGVSPAGAADPVALRIGNRLVGNEEGAAAFEFTLQGGRYEFEQDAIVALTGADFERAGIPMWRATGVTAGSTIEIGPARTGARGYLCVRGGLDVPLVMHSASTHVLSGIGGPLKRGESVAVGYSVAGVPLTQTEPWPYRHRLSITAGAQAGEFDARQAITLASETYQVSDDSNRMGLRLKSAPLAPPHGGQMLSEGVPLGAIQIPPSGQPIILFVDAQTTGGYPVIASVISADLASVGQLRPRDSIAFEFVSLAEARRLLFEQEAAIDAIR